MLPGSHERLSPSYGVAKPRLWVSLQLYCELTHYLVRRQICHHLAPTARDSPGPPNPTLFCHHVREVFMMRLTSYLYLPVAVLAVFFVGACGSVDIDEGDMGGVDGTDAPAVVTTYP